MTPNRRAILPAQLAEWTADQAGQPYRPANGTEGELFEEAWCGGCRRQGWGESPIMCPIRLAAHAFDGKAEQYPRQLVYGLDGQPLCTAFIDRHGPRRRYRCRRTPDLFPRQYYNHQLSLI